jgi:hypothetical protein
VNDLFNPYGLFSAGLATRQDLKKVTKKYIVLFTTITGEN